MKTGLTVLVAIVAAVALTSVAAAGPAASKQRVQIDMKVFPKHTFVLAPLETGALERDSGTQGCKGEPARGEMQRDGQQTWPWKCSAWVFTGKRGTFVLRSEFAWIEAGGPYNIATGTWKVVSGTGQYSRVTGRGRSAQVGDGANPEVWLARYQGFLTSP
jgi:hypothetical protein